MLVAADVVFGWGLKCGAVGCCWCDYWCCLVVGFVVLVMIWVYCVLVVACLVGVGLLGVLFGA